MKQNDLIFSIVAGVLALIIVGLCWGTKREPATIAPPEQVNLGELQTPNADVVMATSLPSGGSSSSGGFGGGRGGMMGMPGGPKGMGGMGMPGSPKGMGGMGMPGSPKMGGPGGRPSPMAGGK